MSPLEYLRMIAVAVVAAAIWFGLQTVMEWREGAIANQQHTQTAHAASGIIADGDASRQEKSRVDVVVTDGRATYEQKAEEAEANEPETASWSDAPVPRSLRDLARERRLARERSRRAGEQREERRGAEDSAER